MGPLIGGFFSIVNTTELHDLQLVESVDVEPTVDVELLYRGPAIINTQIFDYAEGQCSQPSLALFNCIYVYTCLCVCVSHALFL